MIKNERQYSLTKTQASKFKAAIDGWTKASLTNEEHPIRKKAYIDSMQSQYESLLKELSEYESLKHGQVTHIIVDAFDDLPLALIRARIASGLSQRDLADHLGMKEQQIQRYEATDYASASFERLKEVVRALGLSIRKEILISESAIGISNLFNHLTQFGFKKDFVLAKLLPRKTAAFFETPQVGLQQGFSHIALLQAASSIGKIFGIDSAKLLSNEPINTSISLVYATRFKKPTNSKLPQIAPYTIYAHMLALTLLDACKSFKLASIPTDPDKFRNDVIEKYGALNFESALRYTWDLGIPVLPLNDSRYFHGACWRLDGRNVIVLKQKTTSSMRWLNDLLHEVRHASQHPELKDFDVIETNENITKEMTDSDNEIDATEFAAKVILKNRAHELALTVIKRANRDVRHFKSEVSKVAEQENVDVGALANYLAYRLMKEQGVNWWATATVLQSQDSEPWEVAQRILFERVNFDSIPEFEKEILLNALK